MGVWYGVRGSVKVKDTPETRALLALLEDNGEIEVEVEGGDEMFTLSVNGGMHCSGTTASEYDDKLNEFGPFAVQVGYFETVGSVEQIAEGKRQASLTVARDSLDKLPPEDRATLLAEYK